VRKPALIGAGVVALVSALLAPPALPLSDTASAASPAMSASTASAECTEHLAVGAAVEASSTYASHYGPENAVDGECSEGSRWLSAVGDDVPTLTIDLAEPAEIGTIAIYSGSGWPNPFSDTVLVDFTVEADVDGQWEQIADVRDNTDGAVVIETDVEASRVRLVVTGRSRHSIDVARVYEVAVRAPGEGPPAPPPEAEDDFYQTPKGTALEVDAPGVLANDSFPGVETVTASLGSPPVAGELRLDADGSFTYAPAPDFVGVDTFTYLASGGAGDAEATVAVTVTEGDDRAPRRLTVSSVSSPPDAVSGGDALLRIAVPKDIPLEEVSVRLNRRADVTAAFEPAGDRHLIGLVDGLTRGENRVDVTAHAKGRPSASITLVNHPAEGPIFSGPHQQPFACETSHFRLAVIGGTLGEPLDEYCTIEPRTDYFYRTTSDAYRPWPDGATEYPSNLATTTTSLGAEVPFIVRMETSSANRAVVQTTVLHDPLAEPEPSPVARPEGWNGRAVFTLGGGCAGGWYRSGSSTGTVVDAFMLGRGYALMSSSLNVFGYNCNDVVAAETATMTKETFVERYGPLQHTIGYGCSGGSYQAHQIADNYPGIFDGIVVGCSFPEVGFGTVNFLTDARLLETYFENNAEVEWTDEEKRSASGFATYAMVRAMSRGAARIDPRQNCDVVPEDQRYHPEANPGGVRCTVYDHTINVYGADPETGFARRPLDNVGIQYGLGALNDGAITPEQFLDLNERIGGLDADANVVAERTEADLEATRIAYQTGRLTNGGGGLARTPIIDHRSYYDDVSWGDIHVRYHTFSMRERLEKVNGTAANHVSLLEDARHGLFSTDSALVRHAITQMDHWLTNLDGLRGGKPIDRIVRARPRALQEGCNSRDAQPRFIAEELDRNPASECERLYPTASFPREVAGESVAADVIKCQLSPARRDDYDIDWSDEQWERLQRIFDRGVCDYTELGVEQQGLIGGWLRY
jgi:hypothetical protein